MGLAVVGTSVAELAAHPLNSMTDSIFVTIAPSATVNMEFPPMNDTNEYIYIREAEFEGIAKPPWTHGANQVEIADSTSAVVLSPEGDTIRLGWVSLQGTPGRNMDGTGTISINNAGGGFETVTHIFEIRYLQVQA